METVQFVRRSPISGKETSMCLKVDLIKLQLWENNKLLIHRAFPHLQAFQHEFIKSGLTAEEQNSIFG